MSRQSPFSSSVFFTREPPGDVCADFDVSTHTTLPWRERQALTGFLVAPARPRQPAPRAPPPPEPEC